MKDGGPAFPLLYSNGGYQQGMSLRDYFAGQALASGLFASASWLESILTRGMKMDPNLGSDTVIAKACYELADAMLKERDK